MIGEQYVNLIPPDATGLPEKRLRSSRWRNKMPMPTQELLTNLDTFVHSVNTKNLTTAGHELGQAFNARARPGAIARRQNLLLNAAQSEPAGHPGV